METKPFDRLLDVVARLRAEDGCPWDREQTHASLTPYVIEEAYEVCEAIESGDAGALREELGDLLLQVVLHARIAEESGEFDAADVAGRLADKLVARHPHVFGDAEKAASAGEVVQRWERIKQDEKKRKGDASGILDGVPKALPALLKAQRLAEKAGACGFDWADAADACKKLREELGELEADVVAGRHAEAAAELGDVLFVVSNVARHLKIDAEAALQATNAKFKRRFAHVEKRLREQGRDPSSSTLSEMDALWDEAKSLER
jgi:ATP diphosphatase